MVQGPGAAPLTPSATEPCLLAVDGGTESLRAALFDLQGTLLASAATPYPTRFPQPGWAEQDPRDWWQALGRSVRDTVAAAGIDADRIAAMALDTTCCSIVALDAHGEPLRPCLIWISYRSCKTEACEGLTRITASISSPVTS